MSSAVKHHHAIVIGSGFGGSFAAHAIATAGHDVVVLERGQQWQPGTFPRRPDELFDNTWDPSNRRYGMFDFRSFRGLEAVVSSGVGGGSLIYANVLLEKDSTWFATPLDTGEAVDWPVTYADLEPHYATAKALLGGTPFPSEYKLSRTLAFEAAARARGYEVHRPLLAVAFSARGAKPKPGVPLKRDKGAPRRETCRLCGECILGCNFGSKNSLDLTLLRHAGIEVRPLTLVYSIGPSREPGCRFVVRYANLASGADPGISSQPQFLQEMHCDVLIVAAGALGSTELMLRSASSFPGISRHVGSGFSPNGDLLTFGSRIGRRRHARQYVSADTDLAAGPTITATIRFEGADGARFYLQDAALPDQLAWLRYAAGPRAAGAVLGGLRTRALDLAGRDPRTRYGGRFSRTLPRSRIAHTFGVLGMGIDIADGHMRLDGDELQLSWNVRRSRRLLRQIEGASDDIIRTLGGRTWPTTMTSLGRIITVHPVGGLPMGTSVATGVVDSYGEVFGSEGLFITDGSAMPGAVGPNPSLTIAAFALRAADRILERLGPVLSTP